MNWQQPGLKFLGLTRLETTILETLTEPRNPSDVARIAKVVRTSVNYNLKQLVHRGLVERITTGKRHLYVARSPADLRSMMQRASDSIGAHTHGVRIKTAQEDEFIIHVGADEIVPAFVRIVLEIKNDRVKAIQHHRSYTDQVAVLTKEQAVTFNEAIIKNKIIVDGLLNENAYSEYEKKIRRDPESYRAQIETLGGRMADYGVFPDGVFDVHAEIWIFKTTTLVINWKDKIAIEITNTNMTGLIRDMFEYVKSGSRKIDHNEMMRELAGILGKK
jgi:predicted transcriptional regulator